MPKPLILLEAFPVSEIRQPYPIVNVYKYTVMGANPWGGGQGWKLTLTFTCEKSTQYKLFQTKLLSGLNCLLQKIIWYMLYIQIIW